MLIPILLFVSLGLALSFIVANIIANKKAPIVSIVLFVITLAAVLMKYVVQLQTYYQQFLANLPKIDWIYYGVAFVNVFVAVVCFISNTKAVVMKNLVFQQAKLYEQTNVLAYISKRNHLLQASKKLHELLNNDQKDLKLKSLVIENEVIEPKKIQKKWIACAGKVNEVVTYQFVFENNLNVSLKMIKKEIFVGRKLIGYIMLDGMTSVDECNDSIKDLKRSFYIYFDLIDEPVAYYDEDERAYIISRNLMEYFRLEENTIPLDQFRHMLHADDLELYDKRATEANKNQRIQYRLSTKSGYAWFEEGSGNFFGKNFIVLKKINVEDGGAITMGNYKTFTTRVEEAIEAKKVFAIVLLNIHTLPQLIQEQGKDYANIALTKYFEKINQGVLKDQVEMFKIGAIEYALIIEGQEYFELLIRDLNNNVSEVLHQEFFINKTKTEMEAQLGMVLSKDIALPEARTMIKAAFDALKEATDPEFLNDYSIYQAKEDVTLDYSLEDLGIDLSKDDLKEFLEDVKK